jgi:hypothetical protein
MEVLGLTQKCRSPYRGPIRRTARRDPKSPLAAHSGRAVRIQARAAAPHPDMIEAPVATVVLRRGCGAARPHTQLVKPAI